MTGTSPLQYHKRLRLQAVRQWMPNQTSMRAMPVDLSATKAHHSPRREYCRLFGAPPQWNIKRMRLV